MAQIVTRPQRFTPDEWKTANKIKHKNAERIRVQGERLILESDRLDSETREQTDTTLEDVDKKLGLTTEHIVNLIWEYLFNIFESRSTFKRYQILEGRA